MTVVWIALASSVAAALGFVAGRVLARRDGERTAAALRERAEAAAEQAARQLAVGDEKRAHAAAEVQRLTGELAAVQAEVERARRWSEEQFRQLLGEFQSTWAAGGLPARLVPMAESAAAPMAEAATNGHHAHLDSLGTRLRTWMLEMGGGSADLHYQLGLWSALGKRWREAADHFQEAAMRGAGPEAWLALGDAQWALERSDKARLAYRNCLALPDLPDHVLLRYASACVDRREYREAVGALERLLERPAPAAEVHALASLAYGKLNQNESAVQVAERGLALHPNAAELHAKAIIPLFRLGQQEKAESSYLRALELDPGCAEAPFSLGVAHLHRGDEKGAIGFFREALELRPGYPEAWSCLGVAHNRLHQFKKAAGFFEKAIELDPEYAEAYYNLKDTYEGLRDFDRAVAMLRKATLLNPVYR